jgi:hypothetical protein
MPTPPTDRIPLYRTIAIVASCVGLFTACGIGYHGPPQPPRPNIVLSTSYLQFADTPIGATSAPQVVTVTNHSNRPITFDSVVARLPADFPIQTQTCLTTLAPDARCSVTISFRPTRHTRLDSQLLFSGQGQQFLWVYLTGTGLKTPPPQAP